MWRLFEGELVNFDTIVNIWKCDRSADIGLYKIKMTYGVQTEHADAFISWKFISEQERDDKYAALVKMLVKE